MPQRNSVYYLPEEVKQELDRLLIENHFTDYRGLEHWLKNQGFTISKSSIHRYGVKFQSQLDGIKIAAEQAKAIAEACGDDEAMMAEALTSLAQNKLFGVLRDIEPCSDEIELPDLVKAIATLNRSSVNIKKYSRDVKAKVKSASEEVTQVATRNGLSDTAVDEIKRSILGITS